MTSMLVATLSAQIAKRSPIQSKNCYTRAEAFVLRSSLSTTCKCCSRMEAPLLHLFFDFLSLDGYKEMKFVELYAVFNNESCSCGDIGSAKMLREEWSRE